MTENNPTQRLVAWYEDGGRPFIEEHAHKRLPVLDDVLQRLSKVAATSDQELPVCFLGSAGVGKSTLINALVAGNEAVLPQGGVGPLTAQATIVRYATQPSFRVAYLSSSRLNNVLFSLERSIPPEEGQVVAKPAATPSDLDEEERDDIEAAQHSPDDQSTVSKVDEYRKQAVKMIRGDQFANVPVPYLCDRLRQCMGMETVWGTEAEPTDVARMERIKSVIQATRGAKDYVYEVALEGDRKTFQQELEAHASGYLAPLIKTLDVSWDADVLSGGLVLVDLPGIGVANDEYRRVTGEWIRKAKAVVLVVDRAGVTEASVELLRSTGFLTSMLHENLDEGGDPPILSVAVVKVDLNASDARRQDKQLNDKNAKPWLDHFREHCESLKSVIRGQFRDELEKVVQQGGEETLESRALVKDSLLENLEVHPLSAHEYRLFLEDDEDDRPKIKSEEESHVPQFAHSLRKVVERREAMLSERLHQLELEAHEKAAGAIRLVLAQWQQEERAAEEAEKLRKELETFVTPHRAELLTRNGIYREFLRQTLPAHIDAKTHQASETARKDIRRYLKNFRRRDYHWATLRAAVRKGGTFIGAKHIDLPNELTLRFEDPVAIVWTQEILKELRKRTKAHGDDYVRLVGEVVEWTRGQGTRVKPDLVEALHENLKADTRDLGRIGRDAVSELKDAVKSELYEKVQKTVTKRCQRFVRQNKDVGPGVKLRMLELFDSLADEVVEAARPAALEVLNRNYNEVEAEIRAAFEAYPNPLDQAVDAIVSDHEAFVRRSDAQRRRHVIGKGEELLAALPPVEQTAS